ncbi:hypothetical protein CVT24_009340 [Panaeolus cyanescens]|uniref:Choline/carnitine acyltransferase domain-containing protein n=1 Tax=Panaeolus cyanescens TaxID=181874 RepID=A0A409Y7Z5_9AGAR|nr:hypothetical protein CVT24_009340 [Panaeolus cyanescens]
MSTSTSNTRPKKRSRLPIPPLRQSLDRYLASLEPFFLEDEARGGMKADSARALRQSLHVLLHFIALDKVSPYNWLDDNFWINVAYLEWRAPLLINSNWWLAFHEDPMIPQRALSGETNNNRAGTTFWQIRRASWLIHRMLQFKDNVAAVEGAETNTAGSWLLENTSEMFSRGRIPAAECDAISEPPPLISPHARSILLMIHNWCYSVVVYKPRSAADNDPPALFSPGEIEARIRSVALDVESRLAAGEKPVPIGLLSADERDKWAKNLHHLLDISPTNHKSHQAALQTLMGLSLDHITHIIPPSTSSAHPRSSAQNELDSHLHSIRSTTQNVSNRFFDKAFTLIVDPSTRAGATGEHSPVDALVPSIVAEYGVVEGVDVKAFEHREGCPPEDGKGWERLDWVADDKIWKECEQAKRRAEAIIQDSDDSVLWFDGYGTEWIKNFGGYKLSPDAYIQMALQLAWYRTRGEFTATYETVLTRMFKHGRTETLRTYSTESRSWVLAMTNPEASALTRFRHLQNAIASHQRRTREAMTGRGFDRHLLGLRLLLRPLNAEHSALFDDELFAKSSEWKLSTSGLSAGLLFKGTGFGAAYPDGYGINYLAAPNMIKFGIESKFSNPLTSTYLFKEAIITSLKDMQSLCIQASSTPQVHL